MTTRKPFHCSAFTPGVLGVAADNAQLRRRMVMLVQGSSRSPVNTLVAGAVLMLFGVVAFSMPMAGDNVAADMVLPPASPPKIAQAVVVPAAVTTASPMMDVVAAAPKKPTVRRVVTANKTVAAQPMVAAMTDKAMDETAVVSPPPVLTVALAETSVSVTTPLQPQSETAEPPAETYGDWPAIMALAKAADAASGPGISSLTEWNRQAEVCDIPVRKFARLDMNMGKPQCRQLYDAIKDMNQIYSFWHRCETFTRTYNTLALDYSRATAAQFVDRDRVGKLMKQARATISDFCNLDTYRTRYPRMITLIRHAQYSVEGSAVSYNAGWTDYHSAYTNGISPDF